METRSVFARRRIRTFAIAWLTAVSVGTSAAGQTAPPPGSGAERLRVFLDCSSCDLDDIRREVGFVDYVRDRTDADLHVLVTTQATGSGGQSSTLQMIGLGRFQDHDHSHQFATAQTATTDERRRAFTRVFKLALVYYTAGTATMNELDVDWRAPTIDTPPLRQEDPWDFWVFRTSASGSSSGERASGSRSYRFSFSANRVTEGWKINLSTSTSDNRSTFEVDDSLTVESKRDSWSVSSLVVKSLGPRWSVGGTASASHSSFSNTDQSVSFRPGIEFDFFPYAESTRRSLTLLYTIGMSRFRYREVTVFDKLSEIVPSHAVSLSLGLRQPWGSLGAGATYSQHLNHPDRYSASVVGSANIRLFKGFSFNVLAQYGKINDQISLPKGTATRDEILLRLRQLATDYSYRFNVGFSYSFGSIFNNVVNPRFGGGGEAFFFF